jgi:hypothetical protein
MASIIDMRVTRAFLDRSKVINAVDVATRRVMMRMGGTTRKIARRLIRKPRSGGQPSRPGKPPRNQTGVLKNSIFFSYEARNMRVVVGPTLQSSRAPSSIPVPQLLEQGGRVQRKDWKTGKRYVANYSARPYMGPALKIAAPRIPDEWRGVLKAV